MKTKVNGAVLSDRLISLISTLQEDGASYCDVLLDVLNEETDDVITEELMHSDEAFKKLRCVRELYSLIKNIKASALSSE